MKEKLENYVLPRPIEPLPDYAHAKSRIALSERLIAAFDLTEDAATAISNAVVDPSQVRKSIGEPTSPNVEEIAVPGGTLLGIRTHVWARRIMPDPRNPRIGPTKKHPFAVEPGTAGDDSRFRPIPEPRGCADSPQKAQLFIDIENRYHLSWASGQAARYILEDNDWRSSIASQGVMEPVWLVATTFEHGDGHGSATVLTSAEGSSRITAVHKLLEIKSEDIPYDENDIRLRAYYRKLNEAYTRGLDPGQSIALRCERVPALILVGFREHAQSGTIFPTAVKSLVALRHVDAPKPWGAGPENEALADEVLDELARQRLISDIEHRYYAGSCSKAEAREARLSDDPVIRAAMIIRLFSSQKPEVQAAIRIAVTSQSSRKNITDKLRDGLATVLILRAVVAEFEKSDQMRRYLKEAFGKASHIQKWDATSRETNILVTESLDELKAWNCAKRVGDPGKSSLELAVRAAYALVVSGRLSGDRGTANNEQPDRRTPGEVLDAMRKSPQGVYQLGQALTDFAAGIPIRAVDEDGEVVAFAEVGDQQVNDIYLRREFPAAGKAKPAKGDETPEDRLQARVHTLSHKVEELLVAFHAVSGIQGGDGQPLVETFGIESDLVTAWRDQFRTIDEELMMWGRIRQRKYGYTTVRTDQPLEAVDDREEMEPDGEEVEEAIAGLSN